MLPGAGCGGVVGLVRRRSGVGGTALVPALLETISYAAFIRGGAGVYRLKKPN
jgi:hypothetical protein